MIEHFIKTIEPYVDFSKINSVLEVGSRDCLQALEFAEKFKSAQVYSFEANPESAIVCRQNISGRANMQVIESAALDYDGVVDFFPVNMQTSPIKNIGASSIYIFSDLYQRKEPLTQKQILIPCTRVDSWAAKNNVPGFDLLWCDAEASDLLVLKGMGDLLFNVRALQVEVEFQEFHIGQTFFGDLDSYLLVRGFRNLHVNRHDFRSDAIYVNNKFMV